YLDFLDGREWAGFEGNSFWDHTQGWWDARHLPNVLMVHFANLKADLLGQVRRIAAFLNVAPSEETLARIVDHCEIGYMREQARPAMAESAWTEGADTFFHNGTNGRWRDVLTPEEIARCDALAARRLSADCAHWLKTGDMGR
ncbi:MAG TPA: sulfotransferase domain-containing protein, partial [Phenylobacterium sp.]|nr:sulfotransferase domain-containing protein [Phenylobacterium sp.]